MSERIKSSDQTDRQRATSEAWCMAKDPEATGMRCTEPPGHAGDHVAMAGLRLVGATWPQAVQIPRTPREATIGVPPCKAADNFMCEWLDCPVHGDPDADEPTYVERARHEVSLPDPAVRATGSAQPTTSYGWTELDLYRNCLDFIRGWSRSDGPFKQHVKDAFAQLDEARDELRATPCAGPAPGNASKGDGT